MLAPYATHAEQTRGRLFAESRSLTRSEFQRDRDRIIHSGAFRKLRNKTQVFIENEGDYFRTRLTHSLEVAQIARTIARVLQLDEDLAETVALSHDLGHTCFGHAGEDALSESMRPYGGFSHNEQTFRILTKLEQRYAAFDGLNLTWETLEGVVKHNGPVETPTTGLLDYCTQFDLELGSFAGAEAQVAALSDDIAYNTHDIDDGYRAGFITFDDMHGLPLFGDALKAIQKRYPSVPDERLVHEVVLDVIGIMVQDVLHATRRNLERFQPKNAADVRHAPVPMVAFSQEMAEKVRQLRGFLFPRVYRHASINRVCVKAQRIVRELFSGLMGDVGSLPVSWQDAIKGAGGHEIARARIIADYIAGMTDRYAVQEHRNLFSTETMI